MDWTDAGKIVATTIISVGGAGGIIIALSSCIGKIWAERLLIKQKTQMDKELKEYKQELKTEIDTYRTKSENLTFITKLQFETEFKAYQTLFEYMHHADISTRKLFPFWDTAPEDKEKEQQLYIDKFEEHDKVVQPFNEAIDQNAAFINNEIYEKLVRIRNLIHKIKITAKNMMRHYIKKGYAGEYDTINKYNDELSKYVNDIQTDVRTYLTTLKVQD